MNVDGSCPIFAHRGLDAVLESLTANENSFHKDGPSMISRAQASAVAVVGAQQCPAMHCPGASGGLSWVPTLLVSGFYGPMVGRIEASSFSRVYNLVCIVKSGIKAFRVQLKSYTYP